MKMSAEHALEFKDYIAPLRALEKSFKAAGINVDFTLTVWKGEEGNLIPGKAVVIYYHAYFSHSISIEGDSPAQAVKDVAAVVRL